MDMEKYNEAKALEQKTMIRAREIAEELNLQMKISDVEYQGDGNKAIFYYIADERVDFRQLIKVYAEQFRVKIEMKQIGARQEAGRVGGIGPCGRELCCSKSMSNFVSVSTAAARFQDISLNPQKLAGQCGKLKCCLNYEVDAYVEAQRKLPSREIVLDTKDGSFYHFKTDILSGIMTYSSDKYFAANLATIPKDRVYEIIRMNKEGHKPAKLEEKDEELEQKDKSKDILEQENINRFDNNRASKKKKVVKGDRKPILQRQPEVEVQANKDGETEAKVLNIANKMDSATPQRSNNKNRNNRNRNRSRNEDRRNGNENALPSNE
jgi:cell fate regulator YaaT (PSP1 superfamily)